MTDLYDVVQSHLESFENNLSTIIPATVVSYDPARGTISAQPSIQETFTVSGKRVTRAQINNVPVVFPSSGSSLITFPLAKGDGVLLLFSQRSISIWKGSNGTQQVDPDDLRRHHESDAIAIPGLWTYSKAVTDASKHSLTHSSNDVIIKHNYGESSECAVALKSSGDISIESGSTNIELGLNGGVTVNATDVTVNATTTEVNSTTATVTALTTINGNLQVNGTITSTGAIATGAGISSTGGGSISTSGNISTSGGTITDGSGTSLTSHTHSGVQTGGGNTGAPNPGT